MTTATPEKQDGLKVLNEAIEVIKKTIAELGGVFDIQMAVSFYLLWIESCEFLKQRAILGQRLLSGPDFSILFSFHINDGISQLCFALLISSLRNAYNIIFWQVIII